MLKFPEINTVLTPPLYMTTWVRPQARLINFAKMLPEEKMLSHPLEFSL
jgi:hypothetical protein